MKSISKSAANSPRINRLAFDSVNRKKSKKKVYIECHRGFHTEAPENTLAAFKKAIELNVDSIELDIWLTKDEIPVVIHGSEDGEIKNIDKSLIKVYEMEFNLISKFVVNDKNEPIPALEDVLKLCKDKIFLNIEIKDFRYTLAFQKCLELIEKYDMKSQIAMSSFKHQYYEEISKKNECDKIEFGFLYDTTENKKLEFKLDHPNSTINVYFKEITPEFVQKFHDKGIGVHAWFCMNDVESEEIIKYLINCDVDVICSNKPKEALSHREASEIKKN